MIKTTIDKCGIGEYIKLSDKPNAVVYIRSTYEHSIKRFSIYKADDINAERFVPGNRTVFIGFTY